MTPDYRVLVVDDYRDMRELFVAAFDFCTVTALSHGDKAVAAFDSGNFGLLVIDLPHDSRAGFEMIRHVRSIDDQVPIIVVSVRMEDYHPELDRLGIPPGQRFCKPFLPDLSKIIHCTKALLADRSKGVPAA